MNKVAFIGICLASLVTLGFSSQHKCKIHSDVLTAIAAIEGHPKREVGYPYIISFNKNSDMQKLKKDERWFALDKRTIDCTSLENCISVYDELKQLKVTNIDLGPFQINPMFFKYDSSVYFTLEESKQKACEILTEIKNTKGWSWESLARYHSSTKKHNQAYQNRLKQYVANKQNTKQQQQQVAAENKVSPKAEKTLRFKVNVRVASNEEL